MNKTFFLCALAAVLFSSSLFAVTSPTTGDYNQTWKILFSDYVHFWHDRFFSYGDYSKTVDYSIMKNCKKLRLRVNKQPSVKYPDWYSDIFIDARCPSIGFMNFGTILIPPQIEYVEEIGPACPEGFTLSASSETNPVDLRITVECQE